MLTQKDQKNIRSKLDNIYKIFLSKKEINFFENEIIQFKARIKKLKPEFEESSTLFHSKAG